MKILYLPKTFDSGESLSYHGVYGVSIDTENKKVSVSMGSWDSLIDAQKAIKPNVLSTVILNYTEWVPEFYDNIFELVIATYGWTGGTVIQNSNSTSTPPALQSAAELAQIHQLWLSMNSGIIPKVEPFFSEYQLR